MGIGASAADTGAFTMFIYAFDVREHDHRALRGRCAAPGSPTTTCGPAASRFDVPEGWFDACLRVHRAASRRSSTSWTALFFGNAIARGAPEGHRRAVRRGRGRLGRLRAERARQRRRTGTCASTTRTRCTRASTSTSSSATTATRTTAAACGSSSAIESAKIIEQALDQIEAGPCTRRGPAAAHRPARGRRLRPHRVRARARSASTSSPTAATAAVPHERALAGLLQPRAAAACSPSATRCPTSSSSSVRSTRCSGRWTGDRHSCGGCVVGLVAGLAHRAGRAHRRVGGAQGRGAHPEAARAAAGRARSGCCRRWPTRSSSCSRRTSRPTRPTCRLFRHRAAPRVRAGRDVAGGRPVRDGLGAVQHRVGRAVLPRGARRSR